MEFDIVEKMRECKIVPSEDFERTDDDRLVDYVANVVIQELNTPKGQNVLRDAFVVHYIGEGMHSTSEDFMKDYRGFWDLVFPVMDGLHDVDRGIIRNHYKLNPTQHDSFLKAVLGTLANQPDSPLEVVREYMWQRRVT